ncbi:DUF3618 domain-containing protein [Rhodococcus sp. NPDC058639]|uniref:DUF3618 domain-containing protein n=1 Tax=unclassified Rhodococcus (in: high G+C Gram-positive bacteria) TaxID=192944 RepID=UPI00365ABCA4
MSRPESQGDPRPVESTPNGSNSGPEADIAQQRAELAATVGELSDRLDVPTRVKHAADEKVEAVRNRPDLIAAAGAFLAVVVIVAVWRRRRR